jgi:hypothetical protein
LGLILFFAVAVFTLLPFFATVTAAFFVTVVDGFFATVTAPFFGVTFLLIVADFFWGTCFLAVFTCEGALLYPGAKALKNNNNSKTPDLNIPQRYKNQVQRKG